MHYNTSRDTLTAIKSKSSISFGPKIKPIQHGKSFLRHFYHHIVSLWRVKHKCHCSNVKRIHRRA